MHYRKISIQGLVLFLINPLLSFVFSLYNYRKEWAKNIIWGISFFYGLSFVISPNSTSDSVRYASILRVMFNENSSLTNVFANFYLAEGSLDVYQPLVTFFVSRFTDNYNILFAVFGIVFGYFYSRNIWIILKEANSKLNLNQILLILLFGFIISITSGINGVRMYTASHVFIYGVLLYFVKSDKKGLVYIFTSFLFHWSFLLPMSIFSFFLIGKRFLSIHVLMLMYTITFVLSTLNFNIDSNVLQTEVPIEGIQSKTNVYLDSNYVEKVKDTEQSFFLTFNSFLTNIYFLFTFFFFYFFRKNSIKNVKFYNFYLFILFFFSIANVLTLVPSGGRFISIAKILSIGFILLFSFRYIDFKFQKLQFFLSPILVFALIVEIRFFINYIDFSFFFGNIFINLFLDKGIPLGERF
jgi:hypothetical protein